jgi:hypothetical protein
MAAPNDLGLARELATRCQAALRILLKAYTNGQVTPLGVRNFAITIQDLREAGLAEPDLRWLVLRGYVEHATEATAQNCRRTSPSERMLRQMTEACVVLTETGAAWVREIKKDLRRRQAVQLKTPTYDRAARQLRVGARVVKRFRQPAVSQEWILLAFQEQGWPHSIDDPLPPQPGVSCKKHLHDTIQNLNRHQQHRLIHFSGDGTGRRVGWEWRR